MAEPRWIKYDEEAAGANNTDGKEDTMNRASQDYYEAWKARHNDDGTHKLDGFAKLLNDTYLGTGVSGTTETLAVADLTIDYIQISRPDTEYPVLMSGSMAASGTKQVGTAALQGNMIIDISTPGEFTLGFDDAVNTSGVTYSYIILGH